MEITNRHLHIHFIALIMAMAMFLGMMGISGASVYASSTPDQVTSVKIGPVGTTSFKVSWAKAKNASKYEVQYKKSSLGSWKTTSTSGTSATVSGLKQDTTYKVRVRGLNGSSKGNWSSVVKQKTVVPPAAPKSVYPREATKSTLTIAWNAVDKATGYHVVVTHTQKVSQVVKKKSKDKNKKAETKMVNKTTTISDQKVSGTSVKIEKLKAETGYQVKVFAMVSAAQSKSAASATLTTTRKGVKLSDPKGKLRYKISKFRTEKDERLLPAVYVDNKKHPEESGITYPDVKVKQVTVKYGSLGEFKKGDMKYKEVTGQTLKVGDSITTPFKHKGKIKSMTIETVTEGDVKKPEVAGHLLRVKVDGLDDTLDMSYGINR